MPTTPGNVGSFARHVRMQSGRGGGRGGGRPTPPRSPALTTRVPTTPGSNTPSKKAACKMLYEEHGTPKRTNVKFFQDHDGDLEAASAAISRKISESVDLAQRMSTEDWNALTDAKRDKFTAAANWLHHNGQVEHLHRIFGEDAVNTIEAASLLQHQPPDGDDGEASTSALTTISEEPPPAADVPVV